MNPRDVFTRYFWTRCKGHCRGMGWDDDVDWSWERGLGLSSEEITRCYHENRPLYHDETIHQSPLACSRCNPLECHCLCHKAGA